MSVLRVESVGFAYGSQPPVLRNVSFTLDAGECALVLGDNGSGKSTLGRLIGGLASPTQGAIRIDGRPLAGVRTHLRPAKTIYVSQVSYLQFFRATIAEEVALAAKQSGHPLPSDTVLSHFSLPSSEANPRDLTYPEMWRLQLLLLGSVFRPSVMYIDEIVAPGSSDQRAALDFTLTQRRNQGGVTLLAYQRQIEGAFDRVFHVEAGTVVPHMTTEGTAHDG